MNIRKALFGPPVELRWIFKTGGGGQSSNGKGGNLEPAEYLTKSQSRRVRSAEPKVEGWDSGGCQGKANMGIG